MRGYYETSVRSQTRECKRCEDGRVIPCQTACREDGKTMLLINFSDDAGLRVVYDDHEYFAVYNDFITKRTTYNPVEPLGDPTKDRVNPNANNGENFPIGGDTPQVTDRISAVETLESLGADRVPIID